jgi:hypothetical protein
MCDPTKKGWRNHPCFKMWDGHDIALCRYGIEMCLEWELRGYKDNLGNKFNDIMMLYPPYGNCKNPLWLGNKNFHSRYRAALLAKKYEWYSQFGWTEEPKVDYSWGII